MPSVSVCIPVFNGAEFIQQCIESVLSQDFQDIELLILDNASTDDTLEICDRFSNLKVRIHRGIVNIGAHRNFKKCFELAEGELVLLLPCDDLLLPGALETLAAPLLANQQVGLAFGRTRQINLLGDTISEPRFVGSGLLPRDKALSVIVENLSPVQHPLVRKSLYFQQGGFKNKFGGFQDIALWVRIVGSTSETYIAAESTTCVRMHAAQGQNLLGNMSSSNLAKVSAHYGIRSLKQHLYRSGPNVCFLRFAKSFERFCYANDLPEECARQILSELIRANIRALVWALLRRNVDQFKVESAVCRRVFRQFNQDMVLKPYLREVLYLLCHIPIRLMGLVRSAFSRGSCLQSSRA